ncbi:MAG: T9SS type A sorting domain-containing protein [Bacteroidetes bacterium]|nr:T9SS type A sorting domain-containing protein [Bacteroidota bacterium]
MLFASSTKHEMYDFATNTWSTPHNMVQPRANVKAATSGGKSYFAGGGFIGVSSYAFYKNVDIYNASTNTWTTTNLSAARIVGASAAIGNKVLFAGGRQILNYSKVVDIFDVTTGIRTTHNLSQARSGMAVAVVGSKVIFAGGEAGNISSGIYTESNKVDIYDDATGTWSTAILAAKREQITVAVVGTKVLFAGGITPSGLYSNLIDIYESTTNTWTTKFLSETKYGMSAATVDTKVYFVGGMVDNTGVISNKVEIYNSVTNAKQIITISSPRMNMAVAQTPGRVMFAGGIVTWGNVGTDRIEVLNIATNTWTVEYLSRPRLNLASASYGNKAMFAGGAEVLSSYPQYSVISKRVDIWTDPVPIAKLNANVIGAISATSLTFKVYPNPFVDRITIELSNSDQPVSIEIYDILGKLNSSYQLTDMKNELNLSELTSGIYFIKLSAGQQVLDTVRMIKQ